MPATAYLAFDLGAESGRTMLATLDDGRVALEEINRFPNQPQQLPSGLHWNLTELWRNLVAGLKDAVALAKQRDLTITSLGVDTWGVDFALVGRSGQLLQLPYAYRDPRHAKFMKVAVDQVGEKRLYEATGIQLLPFNTLFQLKAQRASEPRTLEGAGRLLFIPDLLHYFFTGKPVNEATIASTSAMVDARTGQWNRKLLDEFSHVSHHFLREITPAGTKIGAVRPAIAAEAGFEADQSIDVIVPGSHDTASAVASVPVTEDGNDWAYLSSGTWSLLGAELDEPIVTEAARKAGFTNERGVADKIRFLKNIAGLWLVQQVRADLAKRGTAYDYATLTELAGQAEPFRTLVHTSHAPFAAPGEMCAKIDAYAEATGQPKPGEDESLAPGRYVRACLESLALTYRQTLDALEGLLGRSMSRLHIVGGGGQNVLLNQMTADALDRPVVVGPFEATAIGNALTQAIGAGHLEDLAALRRVVAASFDLQTYTPSEAEAWSQQRGRFDALPVE